MTRRSITPRTGLDLEQRARLRKKEEELLPVLEPYVQDDGMGLSMLNHEYVQQWYAPGRAAYVNHVYRMKKEQVEKASAEGDWLQYIFLHERPYRFQALMRVKVNRRKLDTDNWWETVRSVWVDSENIWQQQKGWEKIWKAPGAYKVTLPARRRTYFRFLRRQGVQCL